MPPVLPTTPPARPAPCRPAGGHVAIVAHALAAGAIAAGLTAGPLVAPLAAQSATRIRLPAASTVPLGDPAYLLIDELLALVPVPGTVVGQRPYAHAEVRRIAIAANAVLLERERARARRRDAILAVTPGAFVPTEASRAETRAQALVEALREVYDQPPREGRRGLDTAPREVSGRPLESLWLHAVGTRAPERALFAGNGLGTVDGRTLPPLDARGGRPAVEGLVVSLETVHTLGVGSWLGLVAQPRVSVVMPYGVEGRQNVEPQRLLARVRLANVAVQAGIDEWQWGQAGERGMFLSRNARPLRAVSVASDTTFHLPGFLRGLGRWQASAFLADLGATQNFPHAKLAAWKTSVAPMPRLELGAGVMSQFGGRGGPSLSASQRVGDLFPFITWLDEGSDRLASNKLATFEARLRLPELRGTTVFWEMNLDDFDLRRPGSIVRQDAGHVAGLSVARLRDDGTLGLELQAHRTGIRQYVHAQFTSGVTYRRQLIGSPLGPNAQALYGTLTWRPRLLASLALEGAIEERDPSTWTNVNPDPDGTLVFRRVTQGTVERRQRGALVLRVLSPGQGPTLLLRGGAERVRDEGFTRLPRRDYAFGDASLLFRF